MTNLGLQLAWCAWQVSLVLVPAALIHLVASRRSVISGAWFAALALALAVAVAALTWIPQGGHSTSPGSARIAFHSSEPTEGHSSPTQSTVPKGVVRSAATAGAASSSGGLTLALTRARTFLTDLQSRSSARFAPLRRWGRVLAFVLIAGATAGVLRLLGGVWAVHIGRARSRPVDDPGLRALLDSLRQSLDYSPAIEIRALDDLPTPATAGLLCPVILLPENWRTWNDTERRAVLAHELAHVVRADYAAGLVARLAAAIHFYHPLVHWLAARLHWQQEIAADALGARLAGGRGAYLLALSRLALEQDGRSPGWPARAFLPQQGTLIRRIAMLQDESKHEERPWPRSCRAAAVSGLVALVSLALLMPRPAQSRAADEPAAPPQEQAAASDVAVAPIDWIYAPEKTDGFIAVRPAAAFKRFGKPGLAALACKSLGAELSALLFKDQAVVQSNSARFPLEQVEWATAGLRIGPPPGAKVEEKNKGTIVMTPSTIRMTTPFDWLAFLERWGITTEKVRVGERSYYKITGKMAVAFGPAPCFYMPDERTIVLDNEKPMEKLVRAGKPEVPAYLMGLDWQKSSRGLLAVAFDNHDGVLVKHHDFSSPDDAAMLPLWQGAERWVISVADADQLTFHATATCQGDKDPAAIVKATRSLVEQGKRALENPEPSNPGDPFDEWSLRLARGFLKNLQVTSESNHVQLHAEALGAFTEFGTVLQACFQPSNPAQPKRIAAKASKATTK